MRIGQAIYNRDQLRRLFRDHGREDSFKDYDLLYIVLQDIAESCYDADDENQNNLIFDIDPIEICGILSEYGDIEEAREAYSYDEDTAGMTDEEFLNWFRDKGIVYQSIDKYTDTIIVRGF